MAENAEIDLRPIAVDLLVTLSEQAVADRLRRATELVEVYGHRCATLRAALDEAQKLYKFLVEQRDNAALVQRLQEGIVVRVVCPTCKGSGLKPSDVFSGQLNRKSAFESVGEVVQRIEPTEISENERCETCGGKRWILMDRYRS